MTTTTFTTTDRRFGRADAAPAAAASLSGAAMRAVADTTMASAVYAGVRSCENHADDAWLGGTGFGGENGISTIPATTKRLHPGRLGAVT